MVFTLGGDDIEDCVPDREHIDNERGKVEMGEKQERQTRRDNQCDIMDSMWME